MGKRLTLAITAILTGAFFLTPAAPSGGAAGVLYTWESCDQGWKSVEQSPTPTPNSKWHRAAPGATSTMALYNGPPYAGDDSNEYLTSAAHRWRGGRLTLSFDINYNYEPAATRAAEEGIHVEWSRNARTWKRLAFYGETNAGYPAFEHHALKFKAPRGKVYIQFHALSDALAQFNGGAVDNVKLTGVRPPAASKC